MNNSPYFRCDKCGSVINKDEVLTGCPVCKAAPTMSRFQVSLNRVKQVIPQDSWSEADLEHIQTVIEALDRQIPTSLKLRPDGIYGCSYCGSLVSSGANFCGLCGQATTGERER